MRKSSLALLAALTLPLFTACGDDEAEAPTLSAQDKQSIAQSTGMMGMFIGEDGMIDGVTESITGIATGLASSFAPLPGRMQATTCPSFDTSITQGEMSYSIKVTKADGSPFASCADAGNSYATTGLGMKITMTMTSNEDGMAMNMKMNYALVFKPVTSSGGYTISMRMDMSMTMVGQGQSISMSISPMTATVSAASKDAEPTLVGSLSMSVNGITISNLKFTESGVPPQTVDLLKDGAKVGTMVIDANGQATAYDNSGNVIQG